MNAFLTQGILVRNRGPKDDKDRWEFSYVAAIRFESGEATLNDFQTAVIAAIEPIVDRAI